jgi:hypothetical protein
VWWTPLARPVNGIGVGHGQGTSSGPDPSWGIRPEMWAQTLTDIFILQKYPLFEAFICNGCFKRFALTNAANVEKENSVFSIFFSIDTFAGSLTVRIR